MVLQSGVIPYDYIVPRPIRAPINSEFCVGPSSVLLEQAQFVITAERRRTSSSSHILPDFKVYIHQDIAPIDVYEPTTNGTNLNEGSVHIVNHILDTRDALESLLSVYAGDSDHTFEDYLSDWLTQAYIPEVSGAGTFRRIPPPVGIINETDIARLGGSGVLLDIDFGEVMYNPYPYIRGTRFGDIYGRRQNGSNEEFNIQLNPVFPAFRKTDGSIISLNGREPSPTDDPNIDEDYVVTPISSSRTRLDGYCLLSQTNYLAKRNDITVDNAPAGFTFVSSETRDFGSASNVTTSRVLLSTAGLSSGVYKVGGKNPRSTVPNTFVESGVVSFGPSNDKAFPQVHPITASFIAGNALFYGDQEFNTGYHVFNDTMWLTAQSDQLGSPPSGLAVISPFTGHPLWVRFADLSKTSGSGSFSLVSDTAVPSHFGQMVGMYRLGSTIYRVQYDGVRGSASNTGRAIIGTYNDDLDFTGQIETPDDFFTSDPQLENHSDLDYDSINGRWYLFQQNSNNGPGHAFEVFDSTFSNFLAQGNFFAEGAEALTSSAADFDGSYGHGVANGKYWVANKQLNGNGGSSFSHRGSGLWEFEIDNIGSFPDPPFSGVLRRCRLIDMAPFIGFPNVDNFCRIYDIQEVSGGTHLIDGMYILAAWRPFAKTGNDARLFLLRVVERDEPGPEFITGFFDVRAVYDLGPVDRTFTDDPSIGGVMNMIYKEID